LYLDRTSVSYHLLVDLSLNHSGAGNFRYTTRVIDCENSLYGSNNGWSDRVTSVLG